MILQGAARYRYVCNKCGAEVKVAFVEPPESLRCTDCGKKDAMVKQPPQVANHFRPSKREEVIK